MSEWQPVTSAPKDGTRVLLSVDPALGLNRPTICWWDGRKWKQEGGFVLACQPWGWMPLPRPLTRRLTPTEKSRATA